MRGHIRGGAVGGIGSLMAAGGVERLMVVGGLRIWGLMMERRIWGLSCRSLHCLGRRRQVLQVDNLDRGLLCSVVLQRKSKAKKDVIKGTSWANKGSSSLLPGLGVL